MGMARALVMAVSLTVLLAGGCTRENRGMTRAQIEAEAEQIGKLEGMSRDSPARFGLPVYPGAVALRGYPPPAGFAHPVPGWALVRSFSYWVPSASPDRVLGYHARKFRQLGWRLGHEPPRTQRRSPWTAVQGTYEGPGRRIVRVTAYKDRTTKRTEVRLSLEDRGKDTGPSR